MIKAVTVFAGARDQYQVPIALAEEDMLEVLITDAYFPGDQFWFKNTVGAVIHEQALYKRFRAELKSQYVHLSKWALAATIVKKITPQINVNQYKNEVMGVAARQYAARKGSALLSYSNYAYEAFKLGPDQPQNRLLFSIQAHPTFFRRILQQEIELLPFTEAMIMQLYGNGLQQAIVQKRIQEIESATGWLVPSSFLATTLREADISPGRIRIVPYGVNHDIFVQQHTEETTDKEFTIIFAGHITQLKGITYLLDAVKAIRYPSVRVVLCTPSTIDWNILKLYNDLNIQVQIALPQSELARLFNQADLLVFPSLADGFGHVVLEAMSCGLPVITTHNTCGPDVLIDGEHGFIVPIRSHEAIAEKVSWALDNRSKLKAMGHAAAQQARQFTWKKFRQDIRLAYGQLLSSIDNLD